MMIGAMSLGCKCPCHRGWKKGPPPKSCENCKKCYRVYLEELKQRLGVK